MRVSEAVKNSVRYLLLTNPGRGYTQLSSFKAKRMTLPKGDDFGVLFSNSVLLKNGHGTIKNFFSSVEEKSRASQSILGVFFGNAEACVTTDYAFATTAEMNPQVGRNLKVLASSPELVASVTVFRKGVKTEIRQSLLKSL